MGQCFSRLHSKHDISNEEEALGSALPNGEHLSDSRKAKPESTNAHDQEQLDADDKISTTLQADQQSDDIGKIKCELFKELKCNEVGEEGKPIILPDEVKRLWARTHYRKIYTSQVWYDLAWDRNDFMEQFVQIMSVLIRIDFGRWDQFHTIFISGVDRRDKHLPFDLEELQEEDFLGEITGYNFHAAQLAFCPSPIPQQEDEFRLHSEKRLPWIDKPKRIGQGAFGTVEKRTVAKGFLQYQDYTINSRAKAVAIKTLSGVDTRQDEFKNLKELRECLSDHKRIMVNIVTMVEQSNEGDIYHIVYELAAYDLNVFLTNMPRSLREKRHATAGPERTDSANMWPGDLISESVNLADALDYLHNRLFAESHVSLSHNDIKPENILVVYPETTNRQDRFPVGQWKLADFGLSVVKLKRPYASRSKHLSVDNAALSPSNPQKTHRTDRPPSVSNAMPTRDPGQYTAPEWEQTTPKLVDCRSADVWSFGCVLSEIVTYAVQLDCQLVEKFRDSLGKSEQPGQREPQDHRFYDHESKDVKPQFLNHLTNLPSEAHGDKRIPENNHWIGSCVDLIKEVVVQDPISRLSATKIRASLSEIDLSMRDQKRIWLSHDLQPLDTSMLDTGIAVSGSTSAISQSPTEYGDSDHPRDDLVTRVPSICVHHSDNSMPEIAQSRHSGDDERRRATAPR
ncbi:unnamed protein product [Alternaria alternata]